MIDRTGDLQARYWRGMTYLSLNKTDDGLQDFTVVANSEDDRRTQAAIQMSVIYDNIQEFQRSLDVLNKYTFLYDTNTQSKDNITVSYNNRCYAYMQLGDLRKAIDDCTASLKFGSIPDAYHKQQELIKRLKVPETNL